MEMQYIWENERLQTFIERCWPKEEAVSAKSLAAAGFIFLGGLDNVRCAFCGGFLHDWSSSDVPMDVHRRFFPNCSFVKFYEGRVRVLDCRSSPYVAPRVAMHPTPGMMMVDAPLSGSNSVDAMHRVDPDDDKEEEEEEQEDVEEDGGETHTQHRLRLQERLQPSPAMTSPTPSAKTLTVGDIAVSPMEKVATSMVVRMGMPTHLVQQALQNLRAAGKPITTTVLLQTVNKLKKESSPS